MKIFIKILVTGMLMLIFSVCDKDSNPNPSPSPSPQSNSINKIMPLGASRVEGDRPKFESFRFELWKDLIDNGWTFDFIGTQSDNATYPTFNGNNFDVDHEGRSGWTSVQILSKLNDWLNETGAPDIVLFSSPGANDAFQNLPYAQTVSNINSIIDVHQTKNPNITIIIEQMAPVHSNIMTTDLANYFEQLRQDVIAIANVQSTSNSQVIAVDMFTGFADSMLADNAHYNEAGADFIATRYYNELKNVLED